MSAIVPGEWKCPKCGYMLSKRAVSPGGRVDSDSRLDREECPNDGALMVQATERDIIEVAGVVGAQTDYAQGGYAALVLPRPVGTPSAVTERADTVSERFCRLCGRSGFAENFNALTGEALCDPAYTWTASVFLLLAERMNKERGGHNG